MDMFDPDGVLFRGGAHMPLFGFLGNRPRRSDAAILRREQRYCARKGKNSLKGNGQKGSGGKSSWGPALGGKGKKGKKRAQMEAWMTVLETADAPSTVVETLSGWGALAEGKGHAENAPWTTYSQSTNDGNRWGHWRGTQPMALLLVAPTQLPQAPPSMATSSNGQPWWSGV